MINRRKFVQLTGAAALAASTPAFTKQLSPLARRPIPGTDEFLAIVGYGNARVFADGEMDIARELMSLFLDHGGSYVDTSGRARNSIGRIMRERDAHDQLFLGTYIEGKDLPSMRSEIQRLLEVQGGESLDLVLTRAPIDFGKRRVEFKRLKEEGLTRYLGVGRPNKRFYPPMMELMNDNALDFIQVNYSMMEPEAADEILPLAVEKNIAVVINRPFINGDYFSIVKDKRLPEWAAEFDCESWAQFSLKYILSHPAVNCVLTETSNPKHAIENLGAGHGRLPDEQTRERMRQIIQGFM